MHPGTVYAADDTGWYYSPTFITGWHYSPRKGKSWPPTCIHLCHLYLDATHCQQDFQSEIVGLGDIRTKSDFSSSPFGVGTIFVFRYTFFMEIAGPEIIFVTQFFSVLAAHYPPPLAGLLQIGPRPPLPQMAPKRPPSTRAPGAIWSTLATWRQKIWSRCR